MARARDMTRAQAQEKSAAVEVEVSSFSVWNCVITFLQVLLLSTMMYGAGWSQGQQSYNLTPEFLVTYENYRALAFLFCVWSMQSVALALLLIWAVGKVQKQKTFHF